MDTVNRRAVIGALLASAASAPARAQSSDTNGVIRAFADAISAEYHDARQGRLAAQALLLALRNGRYRGLENAALAERANADAQSVLNDAHFMIMAGTMPPGAIGPSLPHTDPHRPEAGELEALRAVNFGVASVRILPGNIGQLDIQPQFYRPIAEVRDRYAAAFSLLADTSGMVVNLANTIGGDPKTVSLVLSYFFDREPFVLNRFHWRTLPVEEFRTTRTPGGPLYGEQRPLVVAITANSYSAAEEFAYDVRSFRRGVLVGEKTPGAANHSLPVIVAGRFTIFIPKARAENPITGTNWEGVGVEPDIAADSGATLPTAHRAALEAVRDSQQATEAQRTSARSALERLLRS